MPLETSYSMQLIVTAMGSNPTDMIEELSRAVKESRCSVEEARMTDMAGDLATCLMVDGNWNHIARLETSLEALASRFNWKLRTHRVEETPQEQPELIPYSVDVYTADQPGALHEVVSFFSLRGIRIHDVTASRYDAPYSDSPLFTAHLIVKVPTSVRVISLRDEFLDFCDQSNLDAIMEPIRQR